LGIQTISSSSSSTQREERESDTPKHTHTHTHTHTCAGTCLSCPQLLWKLLSYLGIFWSSPDCTTLPTTYNHEETFLTL
jgi:hypothetical protein